MADLPNRDKEVKTPSAPGERATPYGTPAHTEATQEFDLSESLLAALRQRYDLLAELGRGGMGVVYKARDRETGDVVALKVLKPEIAGRPELIERFKSELLLARKVTHKNVCRVYDLNRFGAVAAISMEYIEGENLRNVLTHPQGVSLRYGISILRQVLAGLAEAHAQGVVHRDLKPENILIGRDGGVKVMDFGIARSLEGAATATATGMIIGTPAYMSPEQAEGKSADARGDIYSLGLVMYEMFAGQAAFRADTPAALAVKHLHEPPPTPRQFEPHLPSFLERAILRCLEKQPKKRFQSVAELQSALAGEAEAGPVVGEGVEVPLPLHLTRWQRSDWLLVGAALAGLALFFPFFERSSLAPRSKVSFDRSVLRRIAQEYAQRLGAPLSQDHRTGAEPIPGRYDYVAAKSGAPAALELTNNPVPYWEWSVEWRYNDRRPTEVWVDNRGSLTTFTRDFPAGSGTERLSLEEAKPLAEKALTDFFDRSPSELRLESAANDAWRGLPTTSFIWTELKEHHGLQRRYEVRFVGREIAHLDASYDPPAGYVWRPALWQMLPSLPLTLVLLILGFYQRRQVDLAARWRLITVAFAFVAGAWLNWRVPPGPGSNPTFIIFYSMFVGLSFGLVLFLEGIAFERSVRKLAAAKFSSFVRFFDRRALSEPCGLALLRGSFLGLALLGLDSFLIWIGTNRVGMHLDSGSQMIFQAWPYLASPGVSAHLVLDSLFQGLGFCLIIGFLASFFGGLVRRTWVASLAAAGVAAFATTAPIFSLGAVQPYPWKLLLLSIECLLLVWVFIRFDVLTLAATVFTFVFWWQNYRLLVMFEPTGASEQWIAFGLWGLLVAAAAAIAFQASLRTARQRLAAAFE